MSLGMPLQRSNRQLSSGPAQLGPQGCSGHRAAPPADHSAQARRTCPAPAPLHVRRTPRARFCWARLAPPSLPSPAPPVRAPHWLRASSLRPQPGRPPAGRKSHPTSGCPYRRLAQTPVSPGGWPESAAGARGRCATRAGGGFRFRGAGGRAGGRERRRRRLTDNEGGGAALSGGGGGEQRGARGRGGAPAMDNQVRNGRAAPAQPAPPAGPPPSLPSSLPYPPARPSPPRSRPLRSRSAPARPALCAPTAPPGLYVGRGRPSPIRDPAGLQRLRLPCESRSLAAQSPLEWPSQPWSGPDPRGTPLVTPLQPRPSGTLLGTPASPGLPWDSPCDPRPTQSIPPGTSLRTLAQS